MTGSSDSTLRGINWQVGTSIGVTMASIRIAPIYGLSVWGTNCRLGSGRIPLIGDAFQHYNQKKQELLTGNYLSSQACRTFFNETPERAAYFDQLTNSVTRQVPYDGRESILSLYDAGMWQSGDSEAAISIFKKSPVCGLFRPWKGQHGTVRPQGKVTAASQLQLPGTDVYVNSDELNDFTQGTLLHEALHNLTGLYDEAYKEGQRDLEKLLGLTADQCGRSTMCITRKLEEKGCAGTN